MYIGDTANLGLLWLTRELLDVPLDPSRIVLSLNGTGLQVTATCVPPSIEPQRPGRPPFLVDACTAIQVPLDTTRRLASAERKAATRSELCARFARTQWASVDLPTNSLRGTWLLGRSIRRTLDTSRHIREAPCTRRRP